MDADSVVCMDQDCIYCNGAEIDAAYARGRREALKEA